MSLNSKPFWVDTICVPVACDRFHGSDGSSRKALHDVAIERMRETHCQETHCQADAVLVLDSSLLPLASDVTNIEFALRFSHSKWMRHLWTTHEGAVARRTVARIKNGYVSTQTLSHNLLQTIENDQSALSGRILQSLCVSESVTSWTSCMQVSFEEPQHLFRFAWNESSNRGTKYEEDRYVVIASWLGLPGQKMYAFPTTRRSP